MAVFDPSDLSKTHNHGARREFETRHTYIYILPAARVKIVWRCLIQVIFHIAPLCNLWRRTNVSLITLTTCLMLCSRKTRFGYHIFLKNLCHNLHHLLENRTNYMAQCRQLRHSASGAKIAQRKM